MEKYLKERITELRIDRERLLEELNSYMDFETANVIGDLAIQKARLILELESALNHFMQSVEVQSVADNESQSKDCELDMHNTNITLEGKCWSCGSRYKK